MATETYILKRIETMQEELEHLKKTVLKQGRKKTVKVAGIWKGVDFSDKEITKAKKSWLKDQA
jgi:hypothetical protein